MSTIKDTGKDSGAQQNPEPEAGVNAGMNEAVNGDLLSTNNPAFPLSIIVDGVNGDQHDGQHLGENGQESVSVPEVAGDLDTEFNVALAGDAISTPRSAVKIKGRPGGVSLELGEGEWDELIHLLEDRLKTAEGFFRGGRVFLDVGPRPLTEDKLRQVRQLLEAHEMQLAVVRSTSERTLQAAMEVGVSTTNEETQEPMQVAEAPLIVEDGPPNAYTSSPYAPPPDVMTARPNHFVYR